MAFPADNAGQQKQRNDRFFVTYSEGRKKAIRRTIQHKTLHVLYMVAIMSLWPLTRTLQAESEQVFSPNREVVKVTTESVTHPLWTAPMKEDAPHPLQDKSQRDKLPHWPNTTREDIEFTKVTLENRFLRISVAPQLGMRVLNAIDKLTGESLSGSTNPLKYEVDPFTQHKIWTAGYLEHSFPYFEHGMFVRQPAGYRIVQSGDGATSIAMNCRFSHWQHPRHMARHGNYSDRSLSVIVTLRPGERRYTITTRVENPNPLARSERLWTNHHLHAEGYDRKNIIFPAGYVSSHDVWWAQPFTIKPFLAKGGEANYRDKSMNHSLFATFSEHDFAGIYLPSRNFNSLIIRDHRECPGLKLYSGKDGFLELWVGTTTLFEHPGGFVSPYEPVSYTVNYYAANGIGRVDYATRNFAIAADDGKFRLTAPAPAAVRVRNLIGEILAEGRVGPEIKPLTGTTDYPLMVEVNGAPPQEVTLPLQFRDMSHLKGDLRSKGGTHRYELEEMSNTAKEKTLRDALPATNEWLEQPDPDGKKGLSLARACYRLGHFQLTQQILDRLPESGESDYLKALIDWESGKSGVHFGAAGTDSYYMRALDQIGQGNLDAAEEWLQRLIAVRPRVYRPRLMLAWLTRDSASINQLIEENPASPEALLVAELLGDPAAAKEKDKLLQNNPDASLQVELFRNELLDGKWSHIPRYTPTKPHP